MSIPAPPPSMMVDLGDEFAPGHSANVEFKLPCAGYIGRPVVTARLDRLLHQTHWLPQPELHQDAAGHWGFDQSFAFPRKGSPALRVFSKSKGRASRSSMSRTSPPWGETSTQFV